VAGSNGTYKAREDMPDLWPAAAAHGRGRGNTGGTSSGSLELPRHSDIPLQLHLYTILKNLRLQKYIGTGTKNPLTS
jgi:hypothetical protein